MRKVIQHINKIPQQPTFKTAQDFLDSYKGITMKATPIDKLLSGWCIKCEPQKYEKVFAHFRDYNWVQMIGQFTDSTRGSKDWGVGTRILISSLHLYGAYNNDITFNPYSDTVDQAEKVDIAHERSKIKRKDVEHLYPKKNFPDAGGIKTHGGRRRKTKRRRRRRTKRNKN